MLAMMGGMLALQQLSQLEHEKTERRLEELRRMRERISRQSDWTKEADKNGYSDSDDIFPSHWSYKQRVEAVKSASRDWCESQQRGVSYGRPDYY